MKCLLLGGTGFIGKKIQAQRPDWTWVSVGSELCDLVSGRDLEKLYDDFDIIINSAGFYGGLIFNEKYQKEILFRNTAIINSVARLVDHVRPKKIVNIGSACVYPKSVSGKLYEYNITCEDYHPSIRFSAMTKGWLLQVTKNLEIPWEYLVLSNVYGPNEHLNLERSHFIGSLANKIKHSKGTLDMFGDGLGVRDFIYIDDTVEAICRYCELEQATCSVSNISTGSGVSVREITKRLIDISGRDLEVVWGNPEDNGILYKVLDNSKMLNDINYHPQTNIDQGLTKLWQWIQKE